MVGSLGRQFACLVLILTPLRSYAQNPPAVAAQTYESEEIEPRIIGQRGTTMIGISGFVDRAYSTESLMPLNVTAQIDGLRFVTNRIAIHAALAGSGSFGGDAADSREKGAGAPSLHVIAGGLFFLKPRSLLSPYAGAEYWAQVTHRSGKDAGAAVGKFGLQAAISSRAGLFAEGGYGVGLTRGEAGELLTRIVGQVGVRIRF